MIRFYLKMQNRILTQNLLYLIAGIVLFFNLIIRLFPRWFIRIPRAESNIRILLTPAALYTYCDVYLLLIFVILIFFFLGTDYKNSMEDIALAVGGSNTNKFMRRKLVVLLLIYLLLYLISFTNIYTLYLNLLKGIGVLIPLKQIIFYSITANIFVISLCLFLITLFRDIPVSTSVITAYYLVEESLWRCKIFLSKGILGHIYQYHDYKGNEIIQVKVFYLFLSVVFLLAAYKLSTRKVVFSLGKRKIYQT